MTAQHRREAMRLAEDATRLANWKRWGPYLAERPWATVREDYSPDETCWDSFPHDHARSRADRWGEDGLLGMTDRQCRLCFALALWNGRDRILKERLFGGENASPYVKDAFHRYVIQGEQTALNPGQHGTKAAPHDGLQIPPRTSQQVCLRLSFGGTTSGSSAARLGPDFNAVFTTRKHEADAVYDAIPPPGLDSDARAVSRQAYAGLLWSKQFYHLVTRDWLSGDPRLPPPPDERLTGRNAQWSHLISRAVLAMPDKWEYPWFAAWDLAFHMIPFADLDNIGIFDRSNPLPTGSTLQQADGTAWMAFYCLTMMAMAMELVRDDGKLRVAYGDMASKFCEHFVQISDAMNTLGGTGLWDEADGFYYDQIQVDGGQPIRLRIRSMVGLLPLIAVTVLDPQTLDELPGFTKRFDWFLVNRQDLARQISWTEADCCPGHHRWLLAMPSRERLTRVLGYMLDETEFLSPYGMRSLSKIHADNPFVFEAGGESHSPLFGGHSNWRGPVWFPVNVLLIEALERYQHYDGDDFTVECPTESGNRMTLKDVAAELSRRLASLFLPEADGRRPCQGGLDALRRDVHANVLLPFHEYFDAETGRGLGASHQTGWTALVTRMMGVP